MNYESLTGHTCSGCSPELLDRYLKVISSRICLSLRNRGGRQLDVGDLARDRRKLSEPIGFPRLAAFSGRCRILVRGDVMHNRDPHMPCLLAHAIRVDIPQSMEPRSPEPLVHGLQDRADDREIGPPLRAPRRRSRSKTQRVKLKVNAERKQIEKWKRTRNKRR